MNRNISELSLNEAFENGLLSLIKLESENDNSFQETSASLKLLNQLIKYMQSLRKIDDTIASCIQFKLKMIGLLFKSYGVNESIKQAVQAITHKLIKSFDHISSRLLDKEGVLELL